MYHFQNPENRVGTISNLDAFLHRGLNTDFNTKWTGLWTPGYKLLDYYAYKVNGIWLNSENLEAVDYGDEITYYFETESLSVQETVSMPEGLSDMKSELKIRNNRGDVKAVQIGLETGVDIRRRDEDLGPEDYSIQRDSKRVKVEADKSLTITSDRELRNSGEPYLKEHFPGEKQRCIVPGKTVVRTEVEPDEEETVEFRFSSEAGSNHVIKDTETVLEGDLGRIFEASVNSMKNLMYDTEGLGIIAGHPWFQNYWARDTFWTLLGLIDAGYFEESHRILQNFAEKDLPGKINLNGENEAEGRIDTYPLYIIAADKLQRHYKISETIEDGIDHAFEQLELKDRVVQHNPEGTWMDTLERDQAVDVQVLWLRAAEITGEKESELREGLEKFTENEYIRDHLGEDPAHTINPAVGLMYGYFDSEHLSKINAEFSSRYGARTRSVTDPGYQSSGYHTGSSWGLTTCWAAMANLENRKTVEGLNFLEKLSPLLDRDQPGALPEVVDSENGENLGCVEQAWSAGLFIHAIDTYLLGIEITKDEVIIDPCDNYSGKRLNKRVGNTYIDIKVEDGDVEILNQPELERELIT